MSYSGDPSISDFDAVRFHLGDTDADNPHIQDLEIDYALGLFNSDVLLTSAYLAKVIATRYADKRDRTVGPMSINYEAQFRRWMEIANDLKEMARFGVDGRGTGLGARTYGVPELFGGGVSYLGPDDTPLTYDEGEDTDLES